MPQITFELSAAFFILKSRLTHRLSGHTKGLLGSCIVGQKAGFCLIFSAFAYIRRGDARCMNFFCVDHRHCVSLFALNELRSKNARSSAAPW
jgi:hypothetical protein